MKNDSLGDRMKGYEAITRYKAVKKVPLLVRVDGKAFHTLTKTAKKPFDKDLIGAMIHGAKETFKEMQGCKAAYVQSDEVTFLLTDYESINTDAWFDNNIQKIASITASLMSVHFNHYLRFTDFEYNKGKPPVFDARVFTVPKEDVVNCFLWRAKDWKRNSLQMYGRAFFSHKEMNSCNQAKVHEMLDAEGLSWHNDLTPEQKYGTLILKDTTGLLYFTVPANYESFSNMLDRFL